MRLAVLFTIQFMANGLLAWQFVRPAVREDLGLFVMAWVGLIVFCRTNDKQLMVLNELVAGYEGEQGKRRWKKGGKAGGGGEWYGVALTFTGMVLWWLLNPDSIIRTVSFVICWFLVQGLLLLGCTKTESTTNL
jgi:hypothetical protein